MPNYFYFDQMLRYQSELTLNKELSMLKSFEWKNAHNILDIGSGNLYHINRIAERFPDKTFYAFEPDLEIRAFFQKETQSSNLIQINSWEDLDQKFDWVFIRLVLTHVKDHLHLFTQLEKHLHKHSVIWILDADDRNFLLEPLPQYFLEHLGSLRETGVKSSRQLYEVLPLFMKQRGYLQIDDCDYAISGSVADDLMYHYMESTAKMTPMPPKPEVLSELADLHNKISSKVIFGLFAQAYIWEGLS